MSNSPDLASALSEVATRLHTTRTAEETLDAIVHVARESMREIDHAGITLAHRDGRLETGAATDDFVYELDALQYEVRQGPCVSALEDSAPPVTLVEHARHESRWPQFIPAAARRGLRAQLGVRLFAGARTVGALNLYSTSSDVICDETRQLAEFFATHAALAYGHTRAMTDLRGAIETRQLIGQSVGIVMERYGLDASRAFEYLVRVSQTSQMKLRDVARELVENRPAPGDDAAPIPASDGRDRQH